MRTITCHLFILCLVSEATSSAKEISPSQIRHFEAKIRPVLIQNCYRCHSAKTKSKGGLLLDSQQGMLRGGDSGPALVPGNPEKSLLIRAIRYQHADLKMPPKGKLPDNVIADFEHWIRQGAADPRNQKLSAKADPRKHWGFQPMRRATLPTIRNRHWPRSIVDQLILARLESRGITPSKEAGRATLIRRLYFVLLGLPPSYQEVERFRSDDSSDAYERLVDSVLSSPHFGERWGRHWLDVARYADSKGYVFTQKREYADAFRYRDWVVRAFNRDLSYDQFVTQQLAADRLPKSQQNLNAMGFLTLGRRFLNNIHDIIDDRIDVVTRGFMGLTVTCARCHDHKYDPITQKDYYGLYGVFHSSRESGLAMRDLPRPHNVRVFIRGSNRNLGEEAPRRFVRFLSKNDQIFRNGSGRLELAQEIVRRDNPLTARVFVNRVWGHLFGRGLVEGASDLGTRSEKPEHPHLLDRLALDFIDSGWSIKKLIRRLVLSQTFRQESIDREEARKLDPENRLWWRMNRRRLGFEAMRDYLQAVSGRLDRSVGGPAVDIVKRPYSARRTIYGRIDRQNLPSMFRIFDFASPDTHAPTRHQTSVPQQALFLLNHPFLQEQAEHLNSQEDIVLSISPEVRTRRIYRAIYGRDPSKEEETLALRFIKKATPSSTSTLSAWSRLTQVLMISNELHFVD